MSKIYEGDFASCFATDQADEELFQACKEWVKAITQLERRGEEWYEQVHHTVPEENVIVTPEVEMLGVTIDNELDLMYSGATSFRARINIVSGKLEFNMNKVDAKFVAKVLSRLGLECTEIGDGRYVCRGVNRENLRDVAKALAVAQLNISYFAEEFEELTGKNFMNTLMNWLKIKPKKY